jgi:hypothetical protein
LVTLHQNLSIVTILGCRGRVARSRMPTLSALPRCAATAAHTGEKVEASR